MNIYTKIPPTYLCIKQHSITGLKYFCKTSKKDPIKYLGSGVYWKKHIKKHGKEHVITLWVSEPYTDTSIIEHALHFSLENNIVESNEWANLITENGLDGGAPGSSRSVEIRAKISASKIGKTQSAEHIAKRTASSKGRKHSAETKIKLSAPKPPRTKEHSAKISSANKGRVAPNKGKNHSSETKQKISASKLGQNKGVPKSPRTKEHSAKFAVSFFSIIATKKTYNKISLSRYFPEFKLFY